MYHLLNESPMLELALSLLEEGVKQLDTYAPFPGMCWMSSYPENTFDIFVFCIREA